MGNIFKPTWYINSIYAIQAPDLLEHNIHGIICDLDNTLLAWNEVDASSELIDWVLQLESGGIQVYILSNNSDARVSQALEAHDIPYTANALKPLPFRYKAAIEHLQLPYNQIAGVGDQIMTDIIGANIRGIRSILVKPILPHDNIYTWFNRRLERIVMKQIGIDRMGDWGNTLD